MSFRSIRSTLFRILIFAVTGAASAISFTGPAVSDKWILTTPYPEGAYQTKNNKIMAKEIENLTNGRIKITVHSGASLFKAPETKRAVATGQVQLATFSPHTFGNEYPIFTAGTVPFLVRTKEDAFQMWQANRPFMQKILEKEGIVLLHGVIYPAQVLFTNKEIKSFDDFRGVKFRVQSPTIGRLVELMGATGVRVETADIPQAFLTGIIDGMFTSKVTASKLKGWDYIKYVYEVNGWYSKSVTTINKKVFDGLDESTQRLLLAASRVAEKRGWAMEAPETLKATKLLKKHGVNIIPNPPQELMNGFRAAGGKILEEWKKQTGADGANFLWAYNKLRGVK